MLTSRSLFAALALLAAAPLAHAQHAHTAPGETHAHVAPHGGVVRSAGAYHLELVPTSTALAVYLLDAHMSTQPTRGLKGSVLVQQASNATATLPLTPAGPDHLAARLPAGAAVRTAIVTLTTADGQALTVRFDKLDAAHGHPTAEAAYTCPMHPEVTAQAPGKCPKCGMALVRKP